MKNPMKKKHHTIEIPSFSDYLDGFYIDEWKTSAVLQEMGLSSRELKTSIQISFSVEDVDDLKPSAVLKYIIKNRTSIGY